MNEHEDDIIAVMMKCLLWHLLAHAHGRGRTLPHIHYHAINRGVERVFYFPAGAATASVASP